MLPKQLRSKTNFTMQLFQLASAAILATSVAAFGPASDSTTTASATPKPYHLQNGHAFLKRNPPNPEATGAPDDGYDVVDSLAHKEIEDIEKEEAYRSMLADLESLEAAESLGERKIEQDRRMDMSKVHEYGTRQTEKDTVQPAKRQQQSLDDLNAMYEHYKKKGTQRKHV